MILGGNPKHNFYLTLILYRFSLIVTWCFLYVLIFMFCLCVFHRSWIDLYYFLWFSSNFISFLSVMFLDFFFCFPLNSTDLLRFLSRCFCDYHRFSLMFIDVLWFSRLFRWNLLIVFDSLRFSVILIDCYALPIKLQERCWHCQKVSVLFEVLTKNIDFTRFLNVTFQKLWNFSRGTLRNGMQQNYLASGVDIVVKK